MIPDLHGKLEKLTVLAYSQPDYSGSPLARFEARGVRRDQHPLRRTR